MESYEEYLAKLHSVPSQDDAEPDAACESSSSGSVLGLLSTVVALIAMSVAAYLYMRKGSVFWYKCAWSDDHGIVFAAMHHRDRLRSSLR